MSTPADNSQKAVDSAKEMLGHAADAAKESLAATRAAAKEGLQAGREAAAHVADKAHEGLQAAEQHINPIIDDLAARAQDLASRSIHFCADSSERARRQIQCAADATTRYVVEKPGKSLMLAAAAGAAMATAVIWGSRARH